MIFPFRSRRKQVLARVLNLEQMGEQAYDRMYDARRPQDEWRDAREAFSEAIYLAEKAGLKAEAERLQKRLDHIRAVYTHQFVQYDSLSVSGVQTFADPLQQIVRPILGLPTWGVKQGHGSFLTFEFGEPKLEVHERRSEREGLQRTALVHGRWHLWIYGCEWRVVQDDVQLAWNEDDRDTICRALHRLNGQKLSSIEVEARDGCSTFRFDLGGSLDTCPNGNDRTVEQWMLFEDKDVFIYRADGLYSHGPSDVADETKRWLPLR